MEHIRRECNVRVTRYEEELDKHRELMEQFSSSGDIEPGKEIESPKRQLHAALREIEESEEKLHKLFQDMIEACRKANAES